MQVKMRIAAVTAALVAAGAAFSFGSLPAEAATQCGRASWYQLGGKTANGERNNPNAMTAAHRKLPFGTRVRVENLKNGKYVVVRINDRGPFTGGRVIDVSRAAAQQLGMVKSGTAKVRIVVDGTSAKNACAA